MVFRSVLLMISLLVFAATAGGQTVVVDNASPGFAVELGTWNVASSTPGMYGTDYAFADSSSAGVTARCRFTPDLPTTGYYYVSVWYNSGGNRSKDAPYTVHGDSVTSTVRVNQRENGADWFYIGQMHFQAGTAGSVSLANDAGPSVVMADAVQFEYAGPVPGPEPGPATPPVPAEIRGLWVSRFEWPRSTQSATKDRIDTIIADMQLAKFNALFLQVRGAMETLYPSPNEPWAKAGFNHVAQSYDPMAYAIQKTHSAGMQFHAYINTHVIYQGATPPIVPPGQPVHPYYTHGNPDDPAHTDWVYHTEPGRPQPLGEGEELYDWAAPGVPTFQEWVRKQSLYVAENYNVDGIHFDRIRFANQGSYDPISLVRSQIGNPGNPAGLSFRAWNRDQITRFLNDTYGAIAEVNYNRPPGKRLIQVSSAPYRGKSQQESVNQMLGDWTGIGAQDFFAPQVYTTNLTTFKNTLATNFPLANGRGVVAGLSRNVGGKTLALLSGEIQEARLQGALGSLTFSYTGFSSGDFAALGEGVYAEPAPYPDMPWLTNPTDAIIVGNVTDSTGAPLVDVQLSRPGITYKWLSGSDGFYAMLKVPAGQDLALSVNGLHHGFPVKSVPVPALTAGEVRRVDIQLGVTAVDEWQLY